MSSSDSDLARGGALLQMIQQRYPGYHPVMSMVDIAAAEQLKGEEADVRLMFDCHKEVSKYIAPQIKSIEIRGSQQTANVSVTIFDGEATKIENPALPNPVGIQVATQVVQSEALAWGLDGDGD